MTAGCYVCGSEEVLSDADPRNPVCDAHRTAREHVISMQTGKMVCGCGWQILGDYPGEDRQRFCQIHWVSVCAGARLAEGTT